MAKIAVIPKTTRTQDKKVRVAAYCRVSTDHKDQVNSYDAQVRYFSGLYNNSQAEVLVDIYADEGISGTSVEKRAEFGRLMEDCRAGKIDHVITKSISRFARNTKDCLQYIRELKSLGITIYFEKENIDTARLSDEMMITVMGGLKKSEFRMTEYDDVTVRKVIECIRVLSKTEIQIIFKGGFEMNVEVDR